MKINRLFEIIYLLIEKESITARELAEKFEVSTRTIYRDVEILSSVGIPIYMTKGRGGGISLLPNYILDKTVLTDKERENILSSLRAVQTVDITDSNSKQELIQKFSSLFGNSYIDWIEVDFSSWHDYKDQSNIFQIIKSAIFNKKKIRFEYSNSKGEQTYRKVEPLKLCSKGGSWYLYGYCDKRNDYRFFKLMRIKDLTILNEDTIHIAPPKILTTENAFKQKCIHIKLHIQKEMAYRVYDEFDNFTKMEDGSFISEIDMPESEWMLYYISTFGPYCEILEPNELKEKFKDHLEKTLSIYK